MPPVVTKTPLPPSLGPETRITTTLRTWWMFAALIAAGATAWATTPSKADVRSIAEDVSRDSNAARETERAAVATKLAVVQTNQERDRQELLDAVKRLGKSVGRLDDKVDGVLMLTAESRGPFTLRKVKENIATGAKPTEGVIEE